MRQKAIYEIGDIFEKDKEFYILVGIEDEIFQELVSLKDCRIWKKVMQFEDITIEIEKYKFKYIGKANELIKIKNCK